MARSTGLSMNKGEKVAGFCYLPFYFALLPLLIALIGALLGLSLSLLTTNICYYAINLLFVVIVYRHFLARSFRSIRFWDLVQAVILGFAMYYAGNILLGMLLSVLKLQPTSYNNETVHTLVSANRWVMIVSTIVVAPLVEELLIRGLVFGTIHKKNRIAAYVVSILLFSLMHVWQYIPTQGLMPALLSSLLYIIPSIALGWTYEKAGNIWAPIFLHAIVNSISMSLI